MIVPPATAWADRELWNHDVTNLRVRDPLNFLLYYRPTVMLRQTAPQTLLYGNWAAVIFYVQEIDNEEMHTADFGLTKIKPRTPGIYKGWMSASFTSANGTANSTGNRAVGLWKNGVETEWGGDFPPPHSSLPANYAQVYKGIPFYVEMNGTTDYVEMLIAQDNTPAINMTTATSNIEESPEFFMRWWRRS